MTLTETAASRQAPRTRTRDLRRAQVIEATIQCIAEQGFSRTKVTDVAARAGISHGLVLFHFQSKENLLAETLDYLSEEYRQNWQAALSAAAEAPKAQILALIEADFNPTIRTPQRLAAWCAFWGESQSRPLYQARCAVNDGAYNAAMTSLCARMNELHGYTHHPERAARLIRITAEGVWLDMITLEDPYPVAEAIETVMAGLKALYPMHF